MNVEKEPASPPLFWVLPQLDKVTDSISFGMEEDNIAIFFSGKGMKKLKFLVFKERNDQNDNI